MGDIHSLDGPRFMRMAWRVSVYEGVIAMRVREQQTAQSPPEPRQAAATTSARSTSQGSGHKPLAATAVTIPGVFELRKAR